MWVGVGWVARGWMGGGGWGGNGVVAVECARVGVVPRCFLGLIDDTASAMHSVRLVCMTSLRY